MDSKVRDSGASPNPREIDSISSALCDRIVLYVHHSARALYVYIDPIAGTASIVIDYVVPDRGALTLNKTDRYSMTHIVSDGVILHNNIARGVPVIGYTTTIPPYCTVSKRKAFSGLEVDAITTILGDCHVLDLHI